MVNLNITTARKKEIIDEVLLNWHEVFFRKEIENILLDYDPKKAIDVANELKKKQ